MKPKDKVMIDEEELKDMLEVVVNLAVLGERRKIKRKVKWLLKEIEKKKQKILNEEGNPDQYYSGYTVGLMYAKLLIKKAFGGVLGEKTKNQSKLDDGGLG